jgi:hypothetical protein
LTLTIPLGSASTRLPAPIDLNRIARRVSRRVLLIGLRVGDRRPWRDKTQHRAG